MGRALVGDADSYQYLVESIDMHPSQEALKLMMEDAGFESVEYHNFFSGVAAIHRGVRP
jgi:demethylmenaquinone methyltransferase/2-methoxy-6-polyprenyl-1,4-benzoquinol methylase